jgi:type IV pilus assembly protein PilE
MQRARRALPTGVSAGFTLLELLIVVTIVGILASLAWPTYLEQVRTARRADAQVALLELAQFMERYYTANGRYRDAAGQSPGLPFNGTPRDGSTLYYDLGFQAGSVADDRYTLEATPRGAMADDVCGRLRMAHTGARTSSGSLPGGECWRR